MTWRCDEFWRDEYIKLSKEDYRNSTQWERPLFGRPNYWERPFAFSLGDAWLPKLTLTKGFEHSSHAMLNLKRPESSCDSDAPVDRSKRPRDDSDPWSVAWPSDTHRRLKVLGENKVMINLMNGALEVKKKHAIPVRGGVDSFVRCLLGGTFRPRTDKDWCGQIFR